MNVGLPDLSKKDIFVLRFFFLKYGFSQIKSFFKFDSAYFGI